ncbi:MULTISPECIES: alpha/beta fold hydrolase [Pseudomonas]|uniref:Alpha/beta hydrolase n=1 Tax=Pseudomonas salomonii TaxID=191391 RepID=A0A7Y8GA91_9PSED|nr:MULTISPECIES: alpha/beta hydrolase [Pseudomonas]NWF07169.1 alpha/beta hydrolase [Pseudomonas salomonii]
MTIASARSSVGATAWRWTKRILLGLLGLTVLLITFGAIYERVSRYRASENYPPHGRLVDIGGRKIHLDCRGRGSPTVLFESGLDTFGSLSWTKVQNPVAAITRACSYDRAGIMWSEAKTTPQHADAVADDLHATLAAAGEKGPFVLVAHSLGGPYSMAYTRKFGNQVAGLVFVDASHPDQVSRLAAVTKAAPEPDAKALQSLASLSWTGITRLLSPGDEQPNVPTQVSKPVNAYFSTSLAGMASELVSTDQTLKEGGALRTLGNRPLVVLTAMAPASDEMVQTECISKQSDSRQREVWRSLQEDEASWSTRSRHELLPGATHYIQYDRPDAVIAAVRSVVDVVRLE